MCVWLGQGVSREQGIAGRGNNECQPCVGPAALLQHDWMGQGADGWETCWESELAGAKKQRYGPASKELSFILQLI